MNRDAIQIRLATAADFDAVARLIYESTNAWYLKNRGFEAFESGPASCRLFTDVYEELDPGCCVVAEDLERGRIAGSCFYHVRETHVSLGIMNAHADYAGRGVASRLLKYITELADAAGKAVRLVSSAMNLDSFSLYSRARFVPRAFFATMQVAVPVAGIGSEWGGVRAARLEDVAAIEALERRVSGISRARDYRYFIENRRGIWKAMVHERGGVIDGALFSVAHPASRMLGPGFAGDSEAMTSLVFAMLNEHRGFSPLVLAQTDCLELMRALYAAGARNVETHVVQCRGRFQSIDGVIVPTFMPETG